VFPTLENAWLSRHRPSRLYSLGPLSLPRFPPFFVFPFRVLFLLFVVRFLFGRTVTVDSTQQVFVQSHLIEGIGDFGPFADPVSIVHDLFHLFVVGLVIVQGFRGHPVFVTLRSVPTVPSYHAMHARLLGFLPPRLRIRPCPSSLSVFVFLRSCHPPGPFHGSKMDVSVWACVAPAGAQARRRGGGPIPRAVEGSEMRRNGTQEEGGVAAPPSLPPSRLIRRLTTQPNPTQPGWTGERGGGGGATPCSLYSSLLSLSTVPLLSLYLPTVPSYCPYCPSPYCPYCPYCPSPTVPPRHPDRDRGRRGERWRSSR